MTVVNNTVLHVYLNVAKKVDLKSSYHKEEKYVTMCGDGGELGLLW